MAVRFLRLAVTAVGLLVCAAAANARQEPMAGHAAASPRVSTPEALAGRWVFDDDESIEDQRNWRRPVSGRPATLNPPIDGPSGGSMPRGMGGSQGARRYSSGNSSYDASYRRTLRDLMEIAESYAVTVAGGRATFTDDLERVLVFSLDGRKEKHRLAATEFDTRSTWDGTRLTINIEAYGGFRMSQVYLPSEDGKSLFVGMVVQKPKFTPPLKDITRVYRRAAPSSTPARLNASDRSRHLLQRPH